MGTHQADLEWLSMTENRGRRLRDRRIRMGISVRQLADEAGMDRGILAKVEAGDASVRDTTFGKVETALARLEHEMGMDVPEEPGSIEQMEFTVEGDFGVKVTVKGPISDRQALESSVTNIIRSIRESPPDRPQDGPV